MNLHWIFKLILIMITPIFIAGCMPTCLNQCQDPKFLNESWVKHMRDNPKCWIKQADRWFITGSPNSVEIANTRAPASNAISTTAIEAGDFDSIVVAGNFPVQIVGNQPRNSVYIMGPNRQTRQIGVNIIRNALIIEQGDRNAINSRSIVRIGVRNLRKITHLGVCSVLGRNICSTDLSIVNQNCGTIMLHGKMNLRSVKVIGNGSVIVLGVDSCLTDIGHYGHGNVKLWGNNIGVRQLQHFGAGRLEILGAKSRLLTVSSGGNGLTTVSGSIGGVHMSAMGNSRTFISTIQGRETIIYARDNAHIGLAGKSCNLIANLYGNSVLKGSHLNANTAYIQAFGGAHANVLAKQQSFVSAQGSSTIYFLGSPDVITKNTTGRGMVYTLMSCDPKYPWVC